MELAMNSRAAIWTVVALSCRRIGAFQLQHSSTRIQLNRWAHSGETVDLITSDKSNSVKRIQSLLTKRKKRTELSSTVVEGPRIVFDLLTNPKTRPLVQQVVVSIDKPEWTQRLLEFQDLLVCEGTPEVLAKCSDTMTPQGIVATVEIPPEPSRDVSPSTKTHPIYLVCDAVSDPGNIGTLLRSCVAVGVSGVILLPDCCDVWNPKAVRSSMGCCFQVPILQVDSFESFSKVMVDWNVQNVFAATMESSSEIPSIPHYDVDWTKAPSALVIGKEGTGLRIDVRDALDRGELSPVHVPMEPGVESLNAAVCGSVVLFEFHRQSSATKSGH